MGKGEEEWGAWGGANLTHTDEGPQTAGAQLTLGFQLPLEKVHQRGWDTRGRQSLEENMLHFRNH